MSSSGKRKLPLSLRRPRTILLVALALIVASVLALAGLTMAG